MLKSDSFVILQYGVKYKMRDKQNTKILISAF